MNTIHFVECQFDVSDSDVCTMDEVVPVLVSHYSDSDIELDECGDLIVRGRYIVITGVDGAYAVSELEPM